MTHTQAMLSALDEIDELHSRLCRLEAHVDGELGDGMFTDALHKTSEAAKSMVHKVTHMFNKERAIAEFSFETLIKIAWSLPDIANIEYNSGEKWIKFTGKGGAYELHEVGKDSIKLVRPGGKEEIYTLETVQHLPDQYSKGLLATPADIARYSRAVRRAM